MLIQNYVVNCVDVCVCVYVTSNLCSYDHSLCGRSPALLGLGGDAKDVGRLWGQVGRGELTGLGPHLYRDELVGIARIQTVRNLVPYNKDIRSFEVSSDPLSVFQRLSRVYPHQTAEKHCRRFGRVVVSQFCFWELKVQKGRDENISSPRQFAASKNQEFIRRMTFKQASVTAVL